MPRTSRTETTPKWSVPDVTLTLNYFSRFLIQRFVPPPLSFGLPFSARHRQIWPGDLVVQSTFVCASASKGGHRTLFDAFRAPGNARRDRRGLPSIYESLRPKAVREEAGYGTGRKLPHPPLFVDADVTAEHAGQVEEFLEGAEGGATPRAYFGKEDRWRWRPEAILGKRSRVKRRRTNDKTFKREDPCHVASNNYEF
mmetsp:Transcript_38995/g.90737  ORF Transcript_38995/g.90737 Transcript_38995/m.90737 type:complete len:198 (-) Transcript_38995:1925-2518(-)